MQKNIAIVMGGYSSEYNISLQSGNVVYANLDIQKYKGYRIHLLKEKWVYIADDGSEIPVNRHDFSYLMVFLTQFMAVLEKMVICKPTLHY